MPQLADLPTEEPARRAPEPSAEPEQPAPTSRPSTTLPPPTSDTVRAAARSEAEPAAEVSRSVEPADDRSGSSLAETLLPRIWSGEPAGTGTAAPPPPLPAPVRRREPTGRPTGRQAAAPAPTGRSPAGSRTDDEDRKSTRLNSSHVEISYAV